jgi:L-ribulose-5-phosphate 3-epimerase
MTANYVAKETGYAMQGWGHGDRETQAAFRPRETYRERLGALLGDVRALGFDTVDMWGAHLGAEWATDEHLAIAAGELARRGLGVATYATWIGPSNVERACELALGLGTTLIGGGCSGPVEDLVPALRRYGVTLAVENHPEQSPAELLEKIERGEGRLAATVDTGWWATHGYDAAQAILDLGAHVAHVHLKDVRAVGEPHETCRYGEGIVDAEGCVRALRSIGYDGSIAVEHEPELHDPGDECRAMRVELERWLR